MGIFGISRGITEELRAFLKNPALPLEEKPEPDPSLPVISIITPSLNQAPFIERTILSIHNQGYPNLEHIIIDGGSTDETVDIIRRHEAVLDYWHSEPDMGQWDAINRGADFTSGSYMTWINSDDVLLPGTLKKVGTFLAKNPHIDIFYGNMVEIDSSDRVTKRIYTVDFDIRDFLFEVNIVFNQPATFWRTDLFRSIGGLRECRYSMDYDMFYRMFREGATYSRTDRFLSGFRIHPDSLTGSGQVRRGRGTSVDAIFKDYFARDRGFIDSTLMKAWYRARRFAAEPRALLAAVEHRTGQFFRIFHH